MDADNMNEVPCQGYRAELEEDGMKMATFFAYSSNEDVIKSIEDSKDQPTTHFGKKGGVIPRT